MLFLTHYVESRSKDEFWENFQHIITIEVSFGSVCHDH